MQSYRRYLEVLDSKKLIERRETGRLGMVSFSGWDELMRWIDCFRRSHRALCSAVQMLYC